MNTEEIKNYYLKEFSLFDGEYDITFNILDVNTDKMIITVAVTKAGKIFVTEYDFFLHKQRQKCPKTSMQRILAPKNNL